MGQEDQKKISEEISLKDLIHNIKSIIKYIKTKWVTILIVSVLCGALGLCYAILKKATYTAVCTFVLEDSKSGGLGQYAGIASLAGIDLGGNGGGVFEGDNIIALYTSRTMIAKTLLDTADFNGKPQLLIDRYVNFLHLRNKWVKNNNIGSVNFNGPFEKFNRVQDSLLIDIVMAINKKVLSVSKPDKKLNIINVDVQFGDELFAKNFDDKLVATVNDFYVKTKTKKTSLNVQVLQKQTDSVRQVLNSSIGGVASALDAAPNANPALLSLRVPSQRKQVDVQASTAVYAELVKNLELSKISLRQETPLIQVIDNPILPLPVEKWGKVKGFLVGLLLGVICAIGYFTISKVYAYILH